MQLRLARRPLVLALVLSFGLSATLFAQAPRERLDARAVASLVQSFYDQTTTMDAAFEQTQYTKVYDRTERARGRVVFKKPGKMRWDYAAPNGQVFVSDGRRLLIYQPPDEGETEGQLIDRAMSEDQLPLAFSFLTGTGRLDRDFRLRLVDAARQGFEGGYVLELRPRRATPHYDRVLFFVRIVGEGDRRAGVIQRVLILDANGNRNRFDFSDQRFNRDVPEDRFTYAPPARTRRVQP